nr:MAG TPA: hypothetical protein [Caudoviricetes sp.]
MCSFLFTHSIKITSVYNLNEIIERSPFISKKAIYFHFNVLHRWEFQTTPIITILIE